MSLRKSARRVKYTHASTFRAEASLWEFANSIELTLVREDQPKQKPAIIIMAGQIFHSTD
jgi:hypothetical protein